MKAQVYARSVALATLALAAGIGCSTTPYEPYEPTPAAPAPVVPAAPAQVIAVPPRADRPTAQTRQLLVDARTAVDEGRAARLDVSAAAGLLQQAETAVRSGNGPQAEQLARRAKLQANATLNDYFAKGSRAELRKTREHTNLSADQYARLQSAELWLRKRVNKRANDILQALNAELMVAEIAYRVLRGDSLWKISAKEQIYGNPYWWPLIYKNNLDVIKDPDTIEVGQNLRIKQNPLIDDVNMAVQHAHNRGRWAVGSSESADKEYLRRSGANR